MDISTLGAIGEFVSGIAVLITLIYLAYQTRISVRMHEQSVNSLKSQMSSQNADGWVQFFLQTGMDERMSSIVGKLQTAQPLDDSETITAGHFLTAFFLRLENIEFQRTHADFEGIDDLLRKQATLYADSPDFQNWWSTASETGFSDWFVSAISAILQQRLAGSAESEAK